MESYNKIQPEKNERIILPSPDFFATSNKRKDAKLETK